MTLSQDEQPIEFDDPELKNFYYDLEKGLRPDRARMARWIRRNKMPITLNDWSLIKDSFQKAYKVNDEQFEVLFQKPVFVNKQMYKDDFLPLMREWEIKGWLGRYVDYTMGVEPPTAYHFASGLTVLGAALHRQIWFDQRFFKIYPAVQSFLVGPSGKTRKSTAANIAVGMAEESGRVKRLPDMATPEALLRELSTLSSQTGSASALLYSSELATFLNKKEYNQDLVQVLTDLFDCRDSLDRSTIGSGRKAIKNIAVSAILCSNEVWMASSVHESAFGGGLLGRTLVWHQTATDRYFPFPKDAPENLYKRLVGELGFTRYFKGQAKINKAGKYWFEEKYKYTKTNWPDDERLSPFWERYPIHLLRLGMLFNVSRTLEEGDIANKEIVINDHDLLQADAVLKWIYKYLPRVYRYIGNTQWGDSMRYVYDYIVNQGGTSDWTTLRAAMARRMRKSELETILEELVQGGFIRRKPGAKWDGGVKYAIDMNLE
jgi:hypothetical protein